MFTHLNTELDHLLGASDIRIWCTGPSEKNRVTKRKYDTTTRGLSVVRPNKDFIILPRGSEGVDEFITFISRFTGLNPETQIIWTEGTSDCMHEEVDEVIVGGLMSLIESRPEEGFVFIPYTFTPSFVQWCQPFASHPQVRVVGDNFEWRATFGSKAILHRHMKYLDVPSRMETIDPSIPVPHGYICSDTEDLVRAYQMIGHADVIVKPCRTSSGLGIVFLHSLEEVMAYSFPYGNVAIEEKLNLDYITRDNGSVEEISPAIHYIGPNMMGHFLVDQVLEGVVYSGNQPTSLDSTLQEEVLAHSNAIIRGMSPSGPGGFDFLMAEGRPYLVDINVGRFNGSLVPKLFFGCFFNQHSNLRWLYWIEHDIPTAHVNDIWERLETEGIALSNEGAESSGVFPIRYIRDVTWAFIAVGQTDDEVRKLKSVAEEALSQLA